mmetsp:Transcript_26314/g.78148  ORF Transcript_26314/g.78148 Transcript_26314/m.78148 type:complete len:89 (+) Transcript_26314:554-820(+)
MLGSIFHSACKCLSCPSDGFELVTRHLKQQEEQKADRNLSTSATLHMSASQPRTMPGLYVQWAALPTARNCHAKQLLQQLIVPQDLRL